MSGLNFISKSSSPIRSDKDVSINVSIRADGTKEAYLTFRNESYLKFCRDTEYIVYAVRGARMYFKGADAYNGFKLSRPNTVKNGNVYVHLRSKGNKEIMEFAEEHRGSYNLTFDSNESLWCIDTRFAFVGKNGEVY